MVSETGPCFSSPRPQMSNTVFCRCECLRAERCLSAHLESTPSYLYPGVGAVSRDNQCGQQIQRVSGWGIEGAQVQPIRAPATPGWERELAYRQSFEFVVNDAFGGNKVEDVTLKSFLEIMDMCRCQSKGEMIIYKGNRKLVWKVNPVGTDNPAWMVADVLKTVNSACAEDRTWTQSQGWTSVLFSRHDTR